MGQNLSVFSQRFSLY